MPRAHADAPLPAWQRLDLRLCELFHDGCRRELRALFRWIGRLGRGPAWYGLALMLLAFHGETAAVPVLRMLVMGGLGSALYKWLKTRLARPRPFRRSEALATEPPPPEEFSFPSGHTLHAVLHTVLAGACFPWTLWLLVPFTLLTAASRVALGLHYPTDVVAGAVLGGALASLALWLI